MLLTSKDYHTAWLVVPFVVLSSNLIAVTRLFKVPIIFDIRAGYFESTITITAAIIHGLLQFLLISRFGFIGPGMVSVIVSFFLCLVYYFVCRRIRTIPWPVWTLSRLFATAIIGFAATIFLS